MAPQSILGRITQLARANINAVLDAAEDPQRMLDQMVRDYVTSIKDAETAVAQTIGNLRMLEDDAKESSKAAKEWGTKAKAASAKADEMRQTATAAEADKFNDLARVAIKKQIQCEEDVKRFEPLIAEQTEVTENLKSGLTQMHTKLDELNAKRTELLSRAKTAEAQGRMQDITSTFNALDPTTEIGQFEERIRRMEAQVKGKEELVASKIDAQFDSLVESVRDDEVEERLKALK